MLCAEFSIVKVKNYKLCLNITVYVQSLQFINFTTMSYMQHVVIDQLVYQNADIIKTHCRLNNMTLYFDMLPVKYIIEGPLLYRKGNSWLECVQGVALT